MKTRTWVLFPIVLLLVASSSGLAAISPKSPPISSALKTSGGRSASEFPTQLSEEEKASLMYEMVTIFAQMGQLEKALHDLR